MFEFKHKLAVSTWDHEEMSAIEAVIKSGNFTMGARVSEAEKIVADFHQVNHSVMVNSGSSANLLMVAALFFRKNSPLKRGDEVIVPAVSWSTTYFPLAQYGLRVKFVDIDRLSLNFDLDKLRGAVNDRTKVILSVNLLGNPNDFSSIQSIIGDRDIVLLEDNCESLGAEYAGRKTGTFGLMASLSTYFSHHVSTMEGGFVLTSDDELHHIMLSMRSHGWTRHLPKVNHVTGIKSDDEFHESFKFVLPGYNLRPLEFSGATAVTQFRKLGEFLKKRRENALRFQHAIRNIDWVDSQKEIGTSSWFGFSLVPKSGSGKSRDDLRRSLQSYGFECRPIVAGNFARNSVIKFIDHSIHADLSGADFVGDNGLFIANDHSRGDDFFSDLRAALNIV